LRNNVIESLVKNSPFYWLRLRFKKRTVLAKDETFSRVSESPP
jgi:hypothetical protein